MIMNCSFSLNTNMYCNEWYFLYSNENVHTEYVQYMNEIYHLQYTNKIAL
jgi:hypothetical protein